MTGSEFTESVIIFVDRGNCSFATKVYYGELAGSIMVVIVDYASEDLDPDVVLVDDENGK
jgi:hypothetical protein